MKELNIKSVAFRRKPNYSKGTPHKVFENLLNRDFTASKKNIKWCTDFTYIRSSSGKMLYNCWILDLHDRSIMASKISTNINADLAIKTLQDAIVTHKPFEELILHSDQGSQYTSKAFTDFCCANKIKWSMSKAGCPYANAPMRSFYGKLKNEHLNYDYIFRYYHHKRPHGSLFGLTTFERRYL